MVRYRLSRDRRPRIALGILLVAAVLAAVNRGRAEPLKPDQLLLVYSNRNPESRALAAYYAKARGVPEKNMLGLAIRGDREEISRQMFESHVRERIRDYLETEKLNESVRCLVTFYGVPIRVGPMVPTRQEARMLDKLEREFEKTVNALADALHELDAIGLHPPQEPSPRATITDPKEQFTALTRYYGGLRVEVLDRIRHETDPKEARAQSEAFTKIMQRIEGLAGVIEQMQPRAGNQDADAMKARLEKTQEKIKEEETRVFKILRRPVNDPDREEARQWLAKYRGLIGYGNILSADIRMLDTAQSEAAVDSELMLLWWDRYPRHRWVFNPMNWRFMADPSFRGTLSDEDFRRRVLMTCRIDAPTPDIARGLIDKAIAAEKSGVQGKAYLDARGIYDKPGVSEYEDDLRALHKLLNDKTDIEAVLDDKGPVFQPGSCPDALLYCGWYSLRNYVDAFDFKPGAVAYHLASFEAVSFHGPRARGWCKGLLEDGVTVTLGPVAEPYLQSFPYPREFFGLLLTGRFTLAECYAHTTPFTSWMQLLIGDPLYRPYGGRAELTLEDVYPADVLQHIRTSPH